MLTAVGHAQARHRDAGLGLARGDQAAAVPFGAPGLAVVVGVGDRREVGVPVARRAPLTDRHVVDVLRVELLGVVPDDEDVVVATNRGEPLVGDSKSLAGQAYMNVCRRITGDQVPFLDLDAKKGLFGAIAGVFNKK